MLGLHKNESVMPSKNLIQGRRPQYWGLGKCESSSLWLIDSEIAGPIWVKLSGIVKYMVECVLAKEFFKKLEYKKLLFVKLLGNTGCCPFHWAELDSFGVN